MKEDLSFFTEIIIFVGFFAIVIFATGLVYFKKKWLLYYGGADKSTGVAILDLEQIRR